MRPRISFSLPVRLGIRDTYDYLGTAVAMSVAWGGFAASGFFGGLSAGLRLFGQLPGQLSMLLAVMVALAGLALISGPLTAGVFRFARNAASRAEPEFFDLAWGFRKAFARSILLSAIQWFGVALLGGNTFFYISQRHPVGLVVGALFAYALGFWLLTLLYHWPLFVGQQAGTEEAAPVPAVLKKSALLTLDNLPFTLLLGLLILILSILLWFAVIPGIMLWSGAIAMLLTQSTRELLRKYRVLPPDPTLDPITDEGT